MPALARPSAFVWFLIVVVAVLALIVAVLWLIQRQLIYHPGGGVPPVEDVLPGWSEVTLTTTDGLDLGAWYAAPRADLDTPVVVVFPGNAGARVARAPLGSELADRGLGVLLVDYRGYGGNPGIPSESGLALDARAAVRFLEAEAPDRPIVFFGESLGAAVAIELAAAESPAALILRSPFTSIADMAGELFTGNPPGFLLRDRYPSHERIGSVAAPVLVIVGSDDSVVPPAQSRQVYDLVRGPKEFVEVPGADHNDLELLAGELIVDATVRFIDEATRQR